jgi:hypothetical protein
MPTGTSAENAVDAYHLGGGLQPDYNRRQPGVAESDGTLRGCPNVFINSTSVSTAGRARQSGSLTLLARAKYVRETARTRSHAGMRRVPTAASAYDALELQVSSRNVSASSQNSVNRCNRRLFASVIIPVSDSHSD